MVRALRILAGLVLIACLLGTAELAVRDCASGFEAHDNCLWLWLRQRLALPQSKLGRTVTLEFVGLLIVAGLYLIIRFVFPRWSERALISRDPKR